MVVKDMLMFMFTRDAWQDTASDDELRKMYPDMGRGGAG